MLVPAPPRPTCLWKSSPCSQQLSRDATHCDTLRHIATQDFFFWFSSFLLLPCCSCPCSRSWNLLYSCSCSCSGSPYFFFLLLLFLLLFFFFFFLLLLLASSSCSHCCSCAFRAVLALVLVLVLALVHFFSDALPCSSLGSADIEISLIDVMYQRDKL